MAGYKKLWWTLIVILAITFGILGYFGTEVYRKAPPIPAQVVTESGEVLMTETSILDGQTAWQSVGGMQLGSIWGHGAYQAPDWTADWLHRELVAWLEISAQNQYGQSYESLTAAKQNGLQFELNQEYRTQHQYNAASDRLTVGEVRAQAMAQTPEY